MHLAQIKTLLDAPSTRRLTFCRLGRNLRLLQRAIFEPVPPLALYWPFLDNTFPCRAPFWQITHFLIIFRPRSMRAYFTQVSIFVKPARIYTLDFLERGTDYR